MQRYVNVDQIDIMNFANWANSVTVGHKMVGTYEIKRTISSEIQHRQIEDRYLALNNPVLVTRYDSKTRPYYNFT